MAEISTDLYPVSFRPNDVRSSNHSDVIKQSEKQSNISSVDNYVPQTTEDNVVKSGLKERKTDVTAVPFGMGALILFARLVDIICKFTVLDEILQKPLEKLATALVERLDKPIKEIKEKISKECGDELSMDYSVDKVPRELLLTAAQLLDDRAVALQILGKSKEALAMFNEEIKVLDAVGRKPPPHMGNQLDARLAAANMNAVNECCKLGNFAEAKGFLSEMGQKWYGDTYSWEKKCEQVKRCYREALETYVKCMTEEIGKNLAQEESKETQKGADESKDSGDTTTPRSVIDNLSDAAEVFEENNEIMHSRCWKEAAKTMADVCKMMADKRIPAPTGGANIAEAKLLSIEDELARAENAREMANLYKFRAKILNTKEGWEDCAKRRLEEFSAWKTYARARDAYCKVFASTEPCNEHVAAYLDKEAMKNPSHQDVVPGDLNFARYEGIAKSLEGHVDALEHAAEIAKTKDAWLAVIAACEAAKKELDSCKEACESDVRTNYYTTMKQLYSNLNYTIGNANSEIENLRNPKEMQ
jgi:tetratricopeptide (TPR) repeat protein